MIHRSRTGTLVLVLFTMACGGGATVTPGATGSTQAPGSPLATGAPGSPFTEVDRAILEIIPAVDIGADGQPVDPGFTFSPETPQITIVAQAGEVTGSTMDLKWLQVTDEGDVELFTHSVDVAPFQAAYSVGTNPGTLTSGTYRVEAILEGETRSTMFQVEAPASAAAFALSSGAGARGASAVGQGDSGPPASGNSGTVDTPISGVPSAERTVRQWVGWTPVDSDLRTISFQFEVFRETLIGGDWEVQAQATMGGNTRTVYFPMTGQELIKTLAFDPCVHPGGSDLPGTEAKFFVAATAADDSAVAAGDEISTTLGADESRPEVTINSVPPNRSRVEPGDEIVLDATALESRVPGLMTMGPTWQEGLNSFKLIARPGGQVGELQTSVAGSPQSCGSKQWSLTSHATYTVPDDAPTVIKICGEALDFAGNFSDPDRCNEYYTGEAGALSGVTGSYILARDIRTDSGGGYVETDKQITQATFSLVAFGENRLEGQGHMSFVRDYSYAAPTDCPLATGTAAVEWDVVYEGTYEVNSDGTIRVQFTGTPAYGPDYIYTYSIPGCEENNFTETVSGVSTADFDVTLIDGRYHRRDDRELDANQTGEDYGELTVEATNV